MQEPKVLAEEKEYLIIDKPSGWITNDADTVTTQPVLQSWLRSNFSYPLIGEKEERDGIVHRLDKETSGILIVAKTKSAFYNLQEQFKNRVIEKKYLALAHGLIEPKVGTVAATVGRLPWNRRRFGILPGGRESKTDYEVISYYERSDSKDNKDREDNKYSLVRLYPKTGRTHQIRIHLKHINHPIVGDTFYAGRKTARNDRRWCPRLFLHAEEITFKDPTSLKKVTFKSDLPADLHETLEKFSQLP